MPECAQELTCSIPSENFPSKGGNRHLLCVLFIASPLTLPISPGHSLLRLSPTQDFQLRRERVALECVCLISNPGFRDFCNWPRPQGLIDSDLGRAQAPENFSTASVIFNTVPGLRMTKDPCSCGRPWSLAGLILRCDGD